MSIKLPEAKNRPVARTLLLALLLLIAAATAWGLVSWKNRFIQEGVDILDSIREKGLDNIWPHEPRYAYYLKEEDGHVFGMEIHSRKPTADGFKGHIHVYSLSRRNLLTRVSATWALNNDATTGAYQAQIFENGRQVGQTTITLEPGVLSIQTAAPGKLFKAQQTPPKNYVPEGLLPQILAEVVRRKTAARLKITFDHIPPMEGHILYASLFLRYVGPNPDDASLSRLRWTCDCLDPGLSRIVSYYDIDQQGHIIREVTGPIIRRRTTPEELLKHFPEATDIINKTLSDDGNS